MSSEDSIAQSVDNYVVHCFLDSGWLRGKYQFRKEEVRVESRRRALLLEQQPSMIEVGSQIYLIDFQVWFR